VPSDESIAGNETVDLLSRTGSEHPFTGPELASGISIGVARKRGQGLDKQKSYQTVGIHNWTQTGKGTHIRALCQKIKGSTETETT
jgi:hypothetical protein